MSDVNVLRALADCDGRAGEPLGKAMRSAADEIERLQAELREAREMLKRADANCEFWAQESKSGGWSTHQVEPNKKLASEMRAFLAK